MNLARTLLASTCMALVALPITPITPCALLPGVCSAHESAADAPEASVPRSCCSADYDEGSTASHDVSSHDKQGGPCSRGCCRLSSIAPVVEKVAFEPSQVWAHVFVPTTVDSTNRDRPAPSMELLPPPLTLQSLHCLWRC
jgi:hypothetical protein